ncbi:hypothetical protein NOR_03329 [Metarhizium rileyi]|uniref:Restriction of telomere capping protein 4 n=1 Tax=Metarhizium rileyi (strain RCEF 4871) TaxID=1649241 RepID=A0A162LVQ5_METRR|nr:hypothetical protein NOR_03329 [Metarhizium rileyi RCEF 4871]
MPGIRVGLSNRQAPQTLLSTFRPPLKKKVAKNVDDLPVSSDEEEEDTSLSIGSPVKAVAQGSSPPKAKGTSRTQIIKPLTSLVESSGSSGDRDARAERASIKSTIFETERETRSKRRDFPIERADNPRDTDIKRRKIGEASQQTREKTSRSTPPTSSGQHLEDKLGFITIKKSKATYGKKDHILRQQPAKKGPQETRKASLSSASAVAEQKKKKKKLTMLPVPALPQSPERPKNHTLQLPSDALYSSPPNKHTLKTPGSFEPSQEATSRELRPKSRKSKSKERSPSPPPVVFKMPVSISDLQLRSPRKSRTELSLTDDFSDMEDQYDQIGQQGVDDATKNAQPATVCPWCGEPVDKKLLDDFSKGKRLNVRLQSKFCRKHKRKTAEELWQQRRYPVVEWDGLEARFAKYHEPLLDVINGRASYFRSMHEKNISSGKARSMKKEDNMNPGYYGSRGFNLMCDYLVSEFSALLKEKAVDDRVIALRGSAAFIQTVLVAELAVRLIMEDMKVSEEEARVILDESKALGEMIHEET